MARLTGIRCLNRTFQIRQVFPDGKIRERNIELSEKMKAGEDPTAAAHRGLQEELAQHWENVNVRLLNDTLVTEIERKKTESYPGLNVCYEFHTISAFADGAAIEIRLRVHCTHAILRYPRTFALAYWLRLCGGRSPGS